MNGRVLWVWAFSSFVVACNKYEVPKIPAGEGSIVYKQVNKILAYEQPVALDVDDNHTYDILLNSGLQEYNDKPYLLLTARGASQSGNRTIVSTQSATTGNGYWSSPLHEGFTIFENATGERNWSKPNEAGYMVAVMDDGQQTEYNGLWSGKQKRYLGIAIRIGDSIHYGWICMSHDSYSKQIQVHDLAYNKKPGAAIRAGQKKELFEEFGGEENTKQD